MNSTIYVSEVMEELRERNPRFHEAAYLFVISALHHVMDGLPVRRHISACELAEGVRELALDRFGPMARSVLEYWGIQSTADLGHVVFAMVECGILAQIGRAHV